ncbi:hypothetical protein [Acinetobacter sp. YH01022]|uniref:hypothetical protein n=1 Tax=Acinetobacter sp. YH01022 TaxID=2601036 RepID=UPI0015D3B640|nr:hypothetical protein [Acinetobacter sp. YH01022]
MTNERLPAAKDFSLRDNVEWCFFAVASLLNLKNICDEPLSEFNPTEALIIIKNKNLEIGSVLEKYYLAYKEWYESEQADGVFTLEEKRDTTHAELRKIYFKLLERKNT